MSPAPLHERAAVRAWRALGGQRPEALRVDVLKEESPGTAVYRLHLRSDTQPPVIAKRAPRDTAVIERTVYERILPELPLRVLRYHGSVVEASSGFIWLFLEEARGTRYRPRRESHRTAAARWLATLHTRLGEPRAARLLPARDPEHYRRLLRSHLASMVPQMGSPDLGADDRAAFHAVIAHCEWLATRWEELEQVCHGVPDTLVHGDFINHNPPRISPASTSRPTGLPSGRSARTWSSRHSGSSWASDGSFAASCSWTGPSPASDGPTGATR
jgi:hypothetical protein